MSSTPPPAGDSDASSGSSTREAEGRAARRGFLLITGAKAWFLVCGTILNIGLPRLLGDPASFGDFGLVNTFIAILDTVMITGAIQAVSKRTSERPEAAAVIRRGALRLQAVVGGGLFVVLVFGAQPICSLVFGDPTLAPYLRIAAVVTLSYSWYAALIGLVNGLKRFALQAGFDVVYATLKVGLMVGLVVAGYGVTGALAGFAVAAVIITVAALVVTGRLLGRPAPDAEPPRLLRFMLQVMGYVLFVNVLLQADVLVLKVASLEPVRALVDAAGGGPLPAWIAAVVDGTPDPADPKLPLEITSGLAGLFRATKNVSLIPYQAVIAITFVVFPLISRATFQEDSDATRGYVFQTLRSATLMVVFIATLLAAGGEPMLAVLFGDAYRLAGSTLLPLLGGTASFAVFYVMATVLTAAGHPRDALLLAAVAAVLQVGAVYVAVATAPAGEALLTRASWAVLVVQALAVLATALHMRVRLGGTIPPVNALRILASAGAALAAVHLLGGEGLAMIFVRGAVAALAFVATALLTREITREDLALARSTLSRRGSR
ncbi:MAG: lipopolysaccharide biosynthesis protein [Myxococcota bacterium]